MIPQELKIKWPVVTEEDRAAVNDVLDSGNLWGYNAPYKNKFEQEFAAFCDSRYCLATTGGTAALHTALAACSIGRGDEVITSAFSFLATPGAILHARAVPVFADIDSATWNINPAQIERKITKRTRAIIPVHIHGVPCDMQAILGIAERHGLVVIEDACQAPGALYRGRKAGSLGIAAAFSFNGTKNLSAGEGGCLVTSNTSIQERVNWIRQIGEKHVAQQPQLAWNYRSTEMTCAFAWSQLQRLDNTNQQARRNGELLTSLLDGVPGVKVQDVPLDVVSVYHKYRILLADHLDIESVKRALEAEGVDAYYWQREPLPAHPMIPGNYCPGDFPVTEHLLDHSLVLFSERFPIYPQSTELVRLYAAAVIRVLERMHK